MHLLPDNRSRGLFTQTKLGRMETFQVFTLLFIYFTL